MNSRFRLSSKKLSLILAVSIASVLIITVSVLTVALAMRGGDENKLPHTPGDENIGENDKHPGEGENKNEHEGENGNVEDPNDDPGNQKPEDGDGQQTEENLPKPGGFITQIPHRPFSSTSRSVACRRRASGEPVLCSTATPGRV